MRWGLTLLAAAVVLAYAVGMALGFLLLDLGREPQRDLAPHTTTTEGVTP